jgi:cyclophilin family peptidyl-prolyl cis-trans isomerase/HEAT repeat protein
MKNVLLPLLLFCLLFACQQKAPTLNTFDDDVLVRIHDLKDRRLSDSLYAYFTHENPVYKKEAILAFGSIQDSLAVPKLSAVLFNDPDTAIRKAVIFALGQTRCRESRTVLTAQLQSEKDPGVKRELIKAYGKVTDLPGIPKGYEGTSPEDNEALAWALYSAGLNGLADSAMSDAEAKFITPENLPGARLGAAHYFARSAKDVAKHFNILKAAALNDSSAEVRMAALFALRRVVNDSTFEIAKQVLTSEPDARVRVSAARLLVLLPIGKSKDLLFKTLEDKDAGVAVAASEALKAQTTEDVWIDIGNKAGQVKNWRVQANLYEAVLKIKDFPSIVEEVKKVYKSASSPYQKAALLTALQHVTGSLDFIADELRKSDTAVTRTAALSALVTMSHNKNFPPSLKPRMLTIYRESFDLGDPGIIGVVASELSDPKMGYKNMIKDISFLHRAKETLSLPKDFEALAPLERAIAYFEGKDAPKPLKNDFNHPIDWKLVKTIPRDQLAFIYTSKGKVTLKLLVDESPGSVANFVTLARSNYFDHKAFHRVVPNFVIQGGCNRGDGSGSLDYSIRSEFSPRLYKTGSVGMASSGKDTEGTQWFITHSPTPHLDGRYTIFAEVIEGMEVVQRIEAGDEILDVAIAEAK